MLDKLKDRPVFHPFRYQSKVEQCFVDSQERYEIRVGEIIPNQCFVAKYLLRILPLFRFGATEV